MFIFLYETKEEFFSNNVLENVAKFDFIDGVVLQVYLFTKKQQQPSFI